MLVYVVINNFTLPSMLLSSDDDNRVNVETFSVVEVNFIFGHEIRNIDNTNHSEAKNKETVTI